MTQETPAPRRRGLGPRGRRVAAALGIVAALVLALRAALPAALGYGLRRAAEGIGLELALEEVDLGLLRGRVRLSGIEASRRAGAREAPAGVAPPLYRAESLALDLAWRELVEGRLVLSAVELAGPAIRLERRPDGSLAPLLGEPAGEVEPAAPPAKEGAGDAKGPGEGEAEGEAGAGWPLRVERLLVRDAGVRLVEAGRDAPLAALSLGALELRAFGLEAGVATLEQLALREPRVRVREVLVRPGGAAPGEAAPEAPSSADAEPAAESAPPRAPAGAEPGGSAGEEPGAERPAESAPPHRLRAIAIEDARLALLTDEGPIEAHLRLRASGISTAAGERFPVEARLETAEGALALEGRGALDPPGFEGTLELETVSLPRLARALAPERSRPLRGGRASGALELALDASSAPAGGDAPLLRASGTLELTGLDWSEGEAASALALPRLELALRELRVPHGGAEAPVRIEVGRLGLEAPRLRVVREGPEGDAEAGAGDAPEEAGGPPVEVAVGALEIGGGSVELVDRAVSPALRSRMEALELGARGLAWPGPRAESLTLRGRLRDGALALEGARAEASGRLDLELEGLSLAPLDPYLLPAAGFGVDAGRASLDAELALDGERVEGEGRLVLEALDLGATREGDFASTFGVPLDLALALLRDPGGSVSLRVPIAGPLSELRTNTASVVVSALRQALVGTLTTPLKALGAVLPSGGAEAIGVDPFPFPPGAARPARPALERIDALAKVLASRPGLAVSLAGRTGPADAPALAETWLRERALADEPLPPTPGLGAGERERLAEALAASGRGERALADAERALLGRAAESVALPEARLDALARDRGERVRALLLATEGVAAERLTVAAPAAPGDPAVVAELRPAG